MIKQKQTLQLYNATLQTYAAN